MRMEKSRQWFVAAFMAGFICGILFANLFAKEYVTESGIFDPYFLNQYAQSDVPPREYIIYLCGIRILPLCFIILVGQTRIRKAMALFVLGWTGFAGGMLACAGILNMGLAGLAFSLSAGTVEYGENDFCHLVSCGRAFDGGLCKSDPHETVFEYPVVYCSRYPNVSDHQRERFSFRIQQKKT